VREWGLRHAREEIRNFREAEAGRKASVAFLRGKGWYHGAAALRRLVGRRFREALRRCVGGLRLNGLLQREVFASELLLSEATLGPFRTLFSAV